VGKRVVIYVRTSSEQQGGGSSPVEQEVDCRSFAESQGMVVVNIYKDIERYRISKKWVEPSGTRCDRPGLLAMLQDAADDQFDVIVSWREDRLYRGMRAMLLVLETIQQHNLDIMLAKETFDATIAPIKAWLAQIELENIHERMTMGVKARLRAGKANSGQDRYGYKRNGGVIEIYSPEATWVRQIFTWRLEGLSIPEIRRRLIAANAPQKETNQHRKIDWSFSSITGILSSAKEYSHGKKIHTRNGERFEIHLEPIIDMETYEQYMKTKKKLKAPSYDSQQYGLLPGLLVCTCGYKWQLTGATRQYSNTQGDVQNRQTIQGTYRCPNRYEERISNDCPRRIQRLEADSFVWEQVTAAINHPEILITQARLIAQRMQESGTTVNHEKEQIEKELEQITYQRQWTITQTRKGGLTEEDMERELEKLSLQEIKLKQSLKDVLSTSNTPISLNWEAEFQEKLEDLQQGIQALLGEQKNIAEWMAAFDVKRKIVQTLILKVSISKRQGLSVEFYPQLFQRLTELKEANYE
jgi:DNA invertase Pin-like site-specific DNA recombinase